MTGSDLNNMRYDIPDVVFALLSVVLCTTLWAVSLAVGVRAAAEVVMWPQHTTRLRGDRTAGQITQQLTVA